MNPVLVHVSYFYTGVGLNWRLANNDGDLNHAIGVTAEESGKVLQGQMKSLRKY